jgi:3-oxoacyl-[acyl-carrier protein] reductase
MSPEPAAAPVVFVTGAAGGIGSAVCRRLAGQGARVFATDMAERVSAGDHGLRWQPLDVTDEQSVQAALAACRQAFGRVDAVVHLAGRTGRGPLVEVRVEDWRQVLEVNLTSAFFLAKHAYALLRATRGCLILTASTNALNGGSALSGPAYAVAKAGLVNLTRYLAREWAADGIRVNCLAPGPVDTPMTAHLDAAARRRLEASIPMQRFATPDDVAVAIGFLCSRGAGYITGTVHNVSGGLLLD